MAYKALYRTYRPSTFEEVAGQQHIVKTLKNALKTGKLAHAYLFTGPRGTGKTTMAKLLAKSLNCEEGIGCQCNECKNCKAILDGTHPDVLELDAASNNSVDDIRELIDKVKYGTILGRYKVYIIDEVHMLSTGAFNALLKTLEEPPEHVIFILATTEPHKILPTILSRCQRYDFTKVPDVDVKERLRVILEEEGVPFEEGAVDLIISLADGGMRDALSILDQVLRYSGDKLNEQDIMDVFAIESLDEKINLLCSIADKNTPDVLERLNKYTTKGTDIKRLTDDLLAILKDLLIYQTSANTSYLTVLDENRVVALSYLFNEDQTLKMIDALMEAQKDYKNVASVSYLFQVTILKMIGFEGKPQKVQIQPIYQPEEEYEAPKEKAVVPNPVPEIIPEPVVEEPEPVQDIAERAVVKEVKEEPQIQPSLFEQTVEPVEETTKIEEKQIEIPVEKPVETPSIDVLSGSIEPLDEYYYIWNTISGDGFSVNDDLMIEIMVTGKKEIKNDMLGRWSELKKLAAHPKYGKYANMLNDGHILVVSNQVLILEYPLKKSAERMNLINNQKDLQTVINAVFNKKLFIYAVDRGDSVRLQQAYLNRLQVGKLPKANTINIQIEVRK